MGEELDRYINNVIYTKNVFKFGLKSRDLTNDFLIMGILNVTPDSFSDGGQYNDVDSALKRCEEMIEEGADIVDVGGESTRPGSSSVSCDEELRRVVPVIEAIKRRFDTTVSVDTYKSEVAKAVLELGVEIINDISGLNFDKNMIDVLSNSSCGIVAMHIKGKPKDMQKNPHYEHLICEINEYFEDILKKAELNGIEKERIVLDPGIGFGKKFEDNFKIINNLQSFKIFSRPLLVGLSKKSFIGYALNEEDTRKRLFGTIGANVTAFLKGARIFRVHDVRQNLEAIKLAASIIYEKKYT